MTGDHLSRPVRVPAFIVKIGPWLLAIPSIILGILVVELLYYVFFLSGTNRNFDMQMHRVVFLDGSDTIFRNHGDIFTYTPHNDIRNLTAFFFDNDFRIEYDYRFKTNNFGLVQDADVVAERESLL